MNYNQESFIQDSYMQHEPWDRASSDRNPPPPYQQVQPPKSPHTQLRTDEKAQGPPTDEKIQPSASTSSAPHPPPAASFPHLLHVVHKGLTQRRAAITDSDNRILFTIDLHGWTKPHIILFAGETMEEVATVSFHTLSSKIDLAIRGTKIAFKSDSVWSGAHSFVSRASGQRLRWKMASIWSAKDMVCLDDRDLPLARYEGKCWAVKKAGRIEFAEGVQGALLDELLVSGIAMMEHVYRTNQAATVVAITA